MDLLRFDRKFWSAISNWKMGLIGETDNLKQKVQAVNIGYR